MRRQFAILVVIVGLVAACGGGATPTPVPTGAPTPAPTDVFVPTPEPAVAETPEPTPVAGKPYIVKKGDTLLKIANRFDVTVDEILAAHPQIKNANQIAIGDEIVIPPPTPDEVVDDGAITPAP